MAVFVHLVNMPVLFTSTAFAPRGSMPDWLAAVAGWNPLTLAIDLARRGLFQDRSIQTASWLPPLALLAAALVATACLCAFRYADQEA